MGDLLSYIFTQGSGGGGIGDNVNGRAISTAAMFGLLNRVKVLKLLAKFQMEVKYLTPTHLSWEEMLHQDRLNHSAMIQRQLCKVHSYAFQMMLEDIYKRKMKVTPLTNHFGPSLWASLLIVAARELHLVRMIHLWTPKTLFIRNDYAVQTM